MKKLSIGMPVYNGMPFICEALNSLLAQTFSDFELIISDNASSDETEKICRQYEARDSRIRYIRQATNEGAFANFKFVLNEAKGEYFMWAAADDIWDANQQYLAYGKVVQIDTEGNKFEWPSSERDLTYSGPRLVRRLKYLLDNPKYGKANPIYGLYPRKILTPEVLEPLAYPSLASDNLFLYNLLNLVEIKSTNEVSLYKRVSFLSSTEMRYSFNNANSVYSFRNQYCRIASRVLGAFDADYVANLSFFRKVRSNRYEILIQNGLMPFFMLSRIYLSILPRVNRRLSVLISTSLSIIRQSKS
jgi:glycosyltransferase involved in cell wall biosynthesis